MLISPTTQVTPEGFDAIYAEAHGDPALVPWADGRSSPALVTWLNAVAPSLIRCGARVAVVGCGLGEDAQVLVHRGYEVTAFDCSPSAIRWAKERCPDCAACFHVADLFHPPPRWRHRFDLVVEINTIQSLTPGSRPDTVRAIAELLSPHGYLLVICRGATEPAGLDGGPPWPLTERELTDAAAGAGLAAPGPITAFLDGEVPPVLRLRALFRREFSSF